MIYVQGPDVVFRKVDECDLADLAELRSEEWRNFHRVRFVGDRDQADWFDSTRGSHDQIHLVAIRDYDAVPFGMEQMVGVRYGVFSLTNVDWISRVATATWGVFKGHRGHGLGKKIVAAGVEVAFQVFNLRRIECEILAHNLPSIQVAVAAGFECEGVKRQAVWKPGGYVNSHVFGLLRDGHTNAGDCVPLSELSASQDGPSEEEAISEEVIV